MRQLFILALLLFTANLSFAQSMECKVAGKKAIVTVTSNNASEATVVVDLTALPAKAQFNPPKERFAGFELSGGSCDQCIPARGAKKTTWKIKKTTKNPVLTWTGYAGGECSGKSIKIGVKPTGFVKTNKIEGIRVIESKAFKGNYVTADSRYWHGQGNHGGGTVNVINRIGTHNQYRIKKHSDGYYSIASTFFKERYLRMDGSGVNKTSKAPGGKVNLQNRVGNYEKFKIIKNSDGSFSFESVAFPGRFLTLNPNPRAKNPDHAGGKVQVQNRNGSHERFYLLEKK
jgi:phospholipase C